jgi:hypothetical protein
MATSAKRRDDSPLYLENISLEFVRAVIAQITGKSVGCRIVELQRS